MLRLVKTDAGEPAYFLLCDHRQCMEARRGTAIVTNADDFRLTRNQFLENAVKEGWWIDLEGAFCPAHAKDFMHAARESQERGKQVVEAARPQDVMAFGRSR